jgi:hypothetical protein
MICPFHERAATVTAELEQRAQGLTKEALDRMRQIMTMYRASGKQPTLPQLDQILTEVTQLPRSRERNALIDILLESRSLMQAMHEAGYFVEVPDAR